ncbi:glycine cleavage system protein H [Chryseobacterium sp. G0162]|uniref:glycine cleavage system protein H n=1 Tax=Chryseobacterium sp. G0162 TaxID=2487063 RepID=UPI000F50732F|nr:glycine cleavage system protein H [Chryseobacterium sp. G0162]AZB11656.1 glycine cleavage system protein H [Chryseobacterium sp. G0162]
MLTPKNLYYTENHLWLRKIGLYDFYIGITDFGQKEIGEIHLVEFNVQGNNVIKKTSCGTIYGINKTFQLTAPCDCHIIEVNQRLNIKPSHINIDPYNCWLMVFSMDISTDKFLTHEDYIRFTK